MRTLLCLATTISLFTSFPTPSADACGDYGSARIRAAQAFPVSTHVIPSGGGESRRTFVLLGSEAPDGLDWKQLAPMSYDPTLIAKAPARPAMTFTLVGERGERTVTSARYVYLKQTFAMLSSSSLAVELDVRDDETFAVALPGRASGASWQRSVSRRPTPADVAWMKSRGLGAIDAGSLQISHDGAAESLSAWSGTLHATVTVVRRDGVDLGRHRGWVKGVLVVDGTKHVAIQHEGTMQLVRI